MAFRIQEWVELDGLLINDSGIARPRDGPWDGGMRRTRSRVVLIGSIGAVLSWCSPITNAGIGPPVDVRMAVDMVPDAQGVNS